MSISHAVALFTHLIALFGFVSLAATGEVGALGLVVFSIALIVSFLKERYDVGYYLSHNLTTALAVIVTAYVALSTLFLGEELFKGVLLFLVYIQALKLLGSKGTRDIVQIYLLSFFQFLAGAILTIDFSYGLAFITYVTISVWAILALNMRKESEEASVESKEGLFSSAFLVSTAVIAFLIFLGTALIFVSVPRLGFGFLHSPFLSPGELKTGFSEEVELGRVGAIKRDNSPVMRVQINSLPRSEHPEVIYWRGIALDQFDGTTWRVGNYQFNSVYGDRDGIIWVREPEGKPPRGKLIEQTIITEPVDSKVLFAGGEPVAFRGLLTRRIEEINDSYFLPHGLGYRQKYTAYSDLRPPTAGDLRRADNNKRYPRSIAQRYLQLPYLSREVKNLARRITDGQESAYDKALSIEDYLSRNLSYTLTLEKGTEAFPLEEFLFSNRAGHCEYFATAMVVLLREVGIPARIVNGFLGGEWNEFGEFYLIRESDAHSWVEVYFPGYGWARFDPTPSDDSLAGVGALPFIGSYYEYLKYRWSRYVVDFSRRDQLRLLSEVKDRMRWQRTRSQGKFPPRLDFDRRWLLVTVTLALLIWLFFGRVNLLRAMPFGGRGSKDRATVVYERAVRFLERKGFKKRESLTPREFATRVLEGGGGRYAGFKSLTEKYLNLRYGGSGSDEDYQELDSLLARFKKDAP